ncbi:MAG: nucleoside triphosphate pyrophosphohydrolase [Bryobacterales bacterium]|nr:nucleoside triphosphate pyrophosphohydrolase [Bryobacteraceae bacterium]MDW8355659.1 nucleoside triphosphate pyrophosphohydrolase [Bryobacterales bacterium]
MRSTAAATAGEKFQRLVEIMARLRAPDGCPWDRQQTFDTIQAYLLEETYEVLEAIDQRNWDQLAEELGDLMLQAVFFAQMAAEQNLFRIEDSLEAIHDKLVRRHPHVFGDARAETAAEVKRRWDEIKAAEKNEKAPGNTSLLAGIPRALPALAEAQQIGLRAGRAGFDWSNADQVRRKVEEELQELDEARTSGSPERLEQEIGDVLFAIVNLARFLHVDAEQALRRANARFRARFAYIEEKLKERGRPLPGATLEEMEALWQEAKQVR